MKESAVILRKTFSEIRTCDAQREQALSEVKPELENAVGRRLLRIRETVGQSVLGLPVDASIAAHVNDFLRLTLSEASLVRSCVRQIQAIVSAAPAGKRSVIVDPPFSEQIILRLIALFRTNRCLPSHKEPLALALSFLEHNGPHTPASLSQRTGYSAAMLAQSRAGSILRQLKDAGLPIRGKSTTGWHIEENNSVPLAQ